MKHTLTLLTAVLLVPLAALNAAEAPMHTPNAVESANITLTGILAHESALKGGERIDLPTWSHR